MIWQPQSYSLTFCLLLGQHAGQQLSLAQLDRCQRFLREFPCYSAKRTWLTAPASRTRLRILSYWLSNLPLGHLAAYHDHFGHRNAACRRRCGSEQRIQTLSQLSFPLSARPPTVQLPDTNTPSSLTAVLPHRRPTSLTDLLPPLTTPCPVGFQQLTSMQGISLSIGPRPPSGSRIVIWLYKMV